MTKPLSFCTHSEISCKSLEGQEGLRQLIFHVTCNMKDVGSTIGCQRLAGRLVRVPGPLPTVGNHAPSGCAVKHASVSWGQQLQVGQGKEGGVGGPEVWTRPQDRPYPSWLPALVLRDPPTAICPQIPRSYLSLQEAVLAEQQRRSQGDNVQYLTDRQLEQLVGQTPDNDIKDYEDLQSGGPGRGHAAAPAREAWEAGPVFCRPFSYPQLLLPAIAPACPFPGQRKRIRHPQQHPGGTEGSHTALSVHQGTQRCTNCNPSHSPWQLYSIKWLQSLN